MKIWKQIKQWTGFSEDERVQMDRRAFLKGLTVTGAGLLVPMGAVFDLGRGGALVAPSWDLKVVGFTPEMIRAVLNPSRSFASMAMPLLRRRDYSAVGRKMFLVEELPEGALPLLGDRA